MKKLAALTMAVLAVFVCDIALTHTNFIKNSDYFVKNDFEITERDHPEKQWDRVFFGNSVVISSYMEKESGAGYINLGLDYGVVTDLWEMLRGHYIDVGTDLVIGLNYLTLYDEFETNPTYIWHKPIYVPYAYFERDRFFPLIERGFNNLLHGENPLPFKYYGQEKHVYHGRLSDRALKDIYDSYSTNYYNLPKEKFEKNVEALAKVIEYCNDNGIRVRAVWMPWNTSLEMPQLMKDVRGMADAVFTKYGIEVLDLETTLAPECFYDTGHLNYDIGAPRFTELMDGWL
ncbi:MAG: hypothetical protein IJH37_02060 [Clostridia bacterium]|nr:hypothetical protein [Clostridia bacterium]